MLIAKSTGALRYASNGLETMPQPYSARGAFSIASTLGQPGTAMDGPLSFSREVSRLGHELSGDDREGPCGALLPFRKRHVRGVATGEGLWALPG